MLGEFDSVIKVSVFTLCAMGASRSMMACWTDSAVFCDTVVQRVNKDLRSTPVTNALVRSPPTSVSHSQSPIRPFCATMGGRAVTPSSTSVHHRLQTLRYKRFAKAAYITTEGRTPF